MCDRYIDGLPLFKSPTRNLACNPGMCSDWKLNWRPFGSQASAQSTEPHQPGHENKLLNELPFDRNFFSKVKDLLPCV